MTKSFVFENITLGDPSISGHVCYPNAKYASVTDKAHTQIIYKENKFGISLYSRLEVAFSKLAQLFFEKNTIAPQELVVNQNQEVLGVAIDHLCYVINKREQGKRNYCKLKNKVNCDYTPVKIKSNTDIPIYFLDKFPDEYFADLLQAEADKKVRIDYASLANVTAGSYTLEEDDLHKGNICFYLVRKSKKSVPTVVFCKIDHDLMFMNSIMSFYDLRITNWNKTLHAYDISAVDLIDFPKLETSLNFYWPTRKSLFPFLLPNKKYRTDREVDSFCSIGKKPEYIKAKWMNFYKHILISQDEIIHSLSQCLDSNDPAERAHINLITQSIITRQAHLRAVLFSIAEFREFVKKLTVKEKASLVKEVGNKNKTSSKMATYHELCTDATKGITKGDTPLHVAIKLGEYRYDETLQMFGQYINQCNNLNQRPIDIAYALEQQQKQPAKDIRCDMPYIRKHLLENGSTKIAGIDNTEILNTRFKTFYINRAEATLNYEELSDTLREIGEDHSFSLKFKKNLAIECVERFIEGAQNRPGYKKMLLRLKVDMNGDGPGADNFKYIRQHRNSLWFIRQIFGLYGETYSLGEIRNLIDDALSRIPAKEPNCFSFFSGNSQEIPEYSQRPIMAA
ncbi:MAG: hypothetical protein EPN84_10080 [Legionella sp.]|nr:MAG: hypothetical protein EPN84_10080 [Legionella sp.]